MAETKLAEPKKTEKAEVSKKRLGGYLGPIALILGLMWAFNTYITPLIWPAEDAGIRVMTKDANGMIVAQAGDKKTELRNTTYLDANGHVDLQKYRESRRPVAAGVAQARREADAVIAQANGAFPTHVTADVIGGQVGWKTLVNDHNGNSLRAGLPIHVVVAPTDTMSASVGSKIVADADGKPYTELPEDVYGGTKTVLGLVSYNRCMQAGGTGSWWDRDKRCQKEADQGGLMELIGRSCNDATHCTGPIPMGLESVYCSGTHLLVGYNGLAETAIGLQSQMDAAKAVGTYHLEVTQDDYAEGTCALHPDAVIVKINRGLILPAGLITKPAQNQGGSK